ncbi:MAG TPA: hypothetical protein VE174_08660 [Actinomycetota bacterium]|nr:hypothetical protein [Actinomycetota bacterium]
MRFLSIALLSVLVACQVNVGRPSVAPETPAASVTPQRPPTVPKVRVDNGAFGYSKHRLRFAIAELKRLGFWHELTDHLFVIDLGSRLGTANVPQDQHLADASSTGTVEGDQMGALCDLMFYTTAIRQDLDRWRGYYEQGLADEEPPTIEHYWVMLLAHELTHCLPRHHGEKAARRAEDRVRAAYEQRNET